MGSGTAARSGAASALIDRLRLLITSGEYGPGTPLSEVRLAQEFQVSRTPVRESLKQLQIEGLIETRPKVGTFVRETTRRETLEMFELKEVLEGMAARLMARRGACAELDALKQNVVASERATAENDPLEYARLVGEFHQTLLQGADNSKLIDHYRTLMNQLAYPRMVSRSLQRPGRVAQSTSEHRRVVEMIAEKDAHGAERAMRDHVMISAREVTRGSGSHPH